LSYYEFGLLIKGSITKDFLLYLLNVIVTNGSMSIMKDLLLYFIECNYDNWLYEYYEGSIVLLY
jgi:hypothetical protein